MRLLLDTQLVLWWEAGSPKVLGGLKELVDEADAVFFSRASLWEIALKASMGKLRLNVEKFAANIEAGGFLWLDIRNTHLFTVATMPILDDHKDPFDRLLVAQSRTEPLLLITADKGLARYGDIVKVI